ncbi:ATP-binding protein [Rhodoferax sp. OV413]|uniref:sensor histidine kinase n=1 Tax=Rhodoferax sp. OV413 TaxID=1855285 RepID=UPI0025EDC603|nr:ATP-binding protein [Rhodoferax sp. OV413]
MSASNPESVDATSAIAHSTRTMRRAITVGAAIMVLIGLALLYLLTQATNNKELYESNYSALFAINLVVAALLFAAIIWVAYRLVVRLRQGRFGSRLLLKLATIFALVGVLPGVLIYGVSYQFVSRSIETWFDVKVEGALEAGLSLGRVTLDTLTVDLAVKARAAAGGLAESSDAALGLAAERALDQVGASDITIWSGTGRLIASVGQSKYQLSPERPTTSQFRTARQERSLAWVEGLEEALAGTPSSPRIKALVPISSSRLDLSAEPRYMLVSRVLPSSLVSNALAVEAANREYQERALGRQGLKRMYIGTLTLSLFLAVFGAVLLAVVLGNQIARPLLLLTEGVSQVAAGDLRPKLTLQGKDELGGLTRAFASMTRQLADARHAVDQSMSEVSAARSYLQTILDNLTSGVLVLDARGKIQSANPGASRILGRAMDGAVGRQVGDIQGLDDFAQAVQSQFEQLSAETSDGAPDHWQRSFELKLGELTAQGPFDHPLTLVARGARLPSDLRLLVFDDISEIVSAQRAQAWGEVARRLAHEIKNPLTPIQLSAERLQMKLDGKLELAEQAMLTKSVKTIVEQVDAMKRLVNEFRDYARLPAAELKPLQLNALVRDVMQLYETETSSVPVLLELEEPCPEVLGDAEQLRQVIHNLLQNAQDACLSATEPRETPRSVTLRTQWQAASKRVRFSVLDQGDGFPDNILKRAFEPYVTTKARGTGLGLAVVKKISDEHGSRIDLGNRVKDGVVIGAQVSLSLAAAPGASA